MVIVEYCKYGNLSSYLRSKRDVFMLNRVGAMYTHTHRYLPSSHSPSPIQTFLFVLVQVCLGHLLYFAVLCIVVPLQAAWYGSTVYECILRCFFFFFNVLFSFPSEKPRVPFTTNTLQSDSFSLLVWFYLLYRQCPPERGLSLLSIQSLLISFT